MNIFKTTKHYKDWWTNRKADWKISYLDTWNHPHRYFLVGILKHLRWLSLLEIGCNAGPNLANIVKNIPGRQVGGIDVNPEAIALAEKTFKGGYFRVNSADDIMMSDNSTDVVLSDACLIYVGPRKIHKYLREIKRIGRNYLVLCELHSESWLKRIMLRLRSGYFAYNWPRLLRGEGLYDVNTYKIPRDMWPGTPWEEFGYVIVAKIPKR